MRLAYILPDLPENDFRTLVSVQYHTPPVSNEQKKSACIDLVGQLLKSSSEFTGPLRFLETYRNTQDLPARIAQELGPSYVILFEVGE